MTQQLSRVETKKSSRVEIKKLARKKKSIFKKKCLFGTITAVSVTVSLSAANEFSIAEAKGKDATVIKEEDFASATERVKPIIFNNDTPVSNAKQTYEPNVETAVNKDVQENQVVKEESSLYTNPEKAATKSVKAVSPAVETEVEEDKAEENLVLVVEPKEKTSTVELAKVEKKSVVASVDKPKENVSVSGTPVTDVKAENTTENESKVEISEKAPTTNVVEKEETKSENETAKQTSQTLNTTSETSSEQVPVYGPQKETEGSVTGVSGNTITVDVEGSAMVFSTNGDAKLQREINEFTPGTGIVVRYVESSKGEKIIKDLIKVYDEKKGDLTVFITCDFYGMVGPYTITVYENHKATSYQISEDLFGRDFEKEFAPGTKVSLAAVKTDDGIIVENINEL
ncbi:hypothetical protein MZM54_05265 [[Brevibacterium] frigoritolerans]|nr:hypothetical protein [Peribacillus frigoritolerans]